MEDPKTTTNRNTKLPTLIAGGCLTVLFTILCVLVLAVGRIQVATLNAPTSTPTGTPVPRVLVQLPSDQSQVIHDDFSSDENLWGLYYDFGKIEVINGKMILQANVPDVYIIGASRKLAPNGDKYYIQADFSTDTEADAPYGLIFGSNRTLSTYYVFEVWPENETYRLLKHNSGKWTELIPTQDIEFNSYPFPNTLSISFDRGNIELYINGKLASKFTDEDYYQSREIGVFVSNSGYRLLVDDLFLASEK